jgi:hypothetical protein
MAKKAGAEGGTRRLARPKTRSPREEAAFGAQVRPALEEAL